MNSKMALLILCWQTACLSHDKETEKLLPGATSATEAESDELDKIHDELTPDVSWDDFNKLYGNFASAADRTDACVSALKNEPADFKVKVLACMMRIANASREDNNDNNVSQTEAAFIEGVRRKLG